MWKTLRLYEAFPPTSCMPHSNSTETKKKLTKTATLVFALFQQLATLLKFEKNLKFINSTTCENILALHMGFHYIVLLNVSKLHW